VKKSIDLVGGLRSVVKKGNVVALKPNVVTGRVSKPGVLTDKRIIEAMITLCQEAGAGEVQIVEGSGYFTPPTWRWKSGSKRQGSRRHRQRGRGQLVNLSPSPYCR
jgi:uncharacterized protein (DUF362 family)